MYICHINNYWNSIFGTCIQCTKLMDNIFNNTAYVINKTRKFLERNMELYVRIQLNESYKIANSGEITQTMFNTFNVKIIF